MILWIILIICIIAFVIYVALDNVNIEVKNTDVYIENLPEEFNNFTILQMTDLHSKEFGKTLYNKINNLHYDMIAFTGDMLNNKDYKMRSFKNLTDNIKDKKLMVYVDGNNGPRTFLEYTNKVTDFGKQVESLGCTLLKDTYCIEKNDSKIWLSNFDVATNMYYYGEKYFFEEKYRQKFSHIDTGISIGIGHKPASKKMLEVISNKKVKGYTYDLIISGHYHGGQIRLPFYGALVVPARVPKDSLFPNQDMVKGLYFYGRVNQYVSTGLGSSGRIPLLKFRLFNTPNIDIITLKSNNTK